MSHEYLLTGGAGFIGAAVCRALLDAGHRVTVIDNLSTGYRDCVPEGAEFVEGDCGDPSVIDRVPRVPYRAVYHIAGQSSGEISFDNPAYDLRTNTLSTLLLLSLAREVGCERFLYASSMSVYGAQPDAPTPESAGCVPLSFYGVGKLASEHYLRMYEDRGIACTALRLFNVYGPGQNMRNLRQGMVSIFLAQAIDAGRIVVKGSPERYRDFVHIDDVVNAFLTCETHEAARGKVYNVGCGVKTTVGSLLAGITTRLARPAPVEFSGNTPGDQFGIYGDIRLIRRETGWTPALDLDAGLENFVRWAVDRSARQATTG